MHTVELIINHPGGSQTFITLKDDYVVDFRSYVFGYLTSVMAIGATATVLRMY